MSRRVIPAATVLAMLTLLIACVGEDPKPSPDATQGTRGGKCFANGTCNVTLTCSAGVCLPNEGGTNQGGTNEGGTGPCNASFTTQTPDAILCGASPCSPAATSTCCANAGATDCSGTCPGTKLYCTSRLHCGTAHCCTGGAVINTDSSACPARRLVELLLTSCLGTCSDNRRLCSNDADCSPDFSCEPTSFDMGGTQVVLGTCAPR